jgi:hypothetical protein
MESVAESLKDPPPVDAARGFCFPARVITERFP